MVYYYHYHHHHHRLDPSDRRCREILWGNEHYGHFAWKYTSRVAATRHPPERRPVWYSTYKIVGYLGYVTLLVDRNRYDTTEDEDSHEIRSRTDSYPAIADSSSSTQTSTLIQTQSVQLGISRSVWAQDRISSSSTCSLKPQ